MKNRELAYQFIKMLPGEGSNFSSTGDKAFSYFTCIAEWVRGEFDIYPTLILNATKYSRSSSTHLGYIKYFAEKSGTIVRYTTKEVPTNSQDLIKYCDYV